MLRVVVAYEKRLIKQYTVLEILIYPPQTKSYNPSV